MFDFFSTKTDKQDKQKAETARAKQKGPRLNLNFNQNTDESLSGRPGVNIYYPKSYDDVREIIDLLIVGKQAVVNLNDLHEETAQRVIDLLCGAVYALKGGLCEIESNIFVITRRRFRQLTAKRAQGSRFSTDSTHAFGTLAISCAHFLSQASNAIEFFNLNLKSARR